MKETLRQNPFPRLTTLDARVQSKKDNLDCIVSLDINEDEIELGESLYRIGFTKAYLHVICSGLQVVPETRYGIAKKPEIEEIKLKRKDTMEDQSSNSHNYSARAGMTAMGASGALREKSKNAIKQHTESIETQSVVRVRPKGEGLWEISERDAQLLNGTYISGDLLASFRAALGSNRGFLSIFIELRQRDMQFELTSAKWAPKWSFGRSKNKEAVFGVLVAKTLAKQIDNEASYRGAVIISAVEISDDQL